MTRNFIRLLLICGVTFSCIETVKESGSLNNEPFDWNSVIVTPHDYDYPKGPTFKLLSWNVEHFIDPYDDPYIDNDRENSPPDNMPLRRKLLIDALKEADADIVVLQEFESAKYLKQLAQDSFPDMEYKFFADIPSHNWYMNVVVMSRFPMGIIRGYGSATTPLPEYVSEEGKKETQNHINTRMWSIDVYPAEDYNFVLTGLHLKAGRGDRNIAMRKGQMNLLTAQFNRMLTEDPDKNMIVAGDLNSTPNSEEIGLLVRNNVLKNGFIDPLDTSIYTHPSNKPRRRLDYILINENMDPEVEDIRVESFFSPDTMRIISDHLPLTGVFLKKEMD